MKTPLFFILLCIPYMHYYILDYNFNEGVDMGIFKKLFKPKFDPRPPESQSLVHTGGVVWRGIDITIPPDACLEFTVYDDLRDVLMYSKIIPMMDLTRCMVNLTVVENWNGSATVRLSNRGELTYTLPAGQPILKFEVV